MAAGAAVVKALRTLRPSALAEAVRFPCTAEPVLPPVSCVLSPAWRRTCPVRTLRLSAASCAGHNKWSKVKNIKGPKDLARAKVFAKLSFEIKIAVKDGGPNPAFNASLAQVLDRCRSSNMPKASIDQAIKSSQKSKVAELIYEIRGPGGCLILLEILTDSVSRFRQEIKYLLAKKGGTLSDIAQNFSKRGMVVVPGQNLTMDQALELAIEAGAEDVQLTEDEEERPVLQFICDMVDLKSVQTSLEGLGMQIVSTGLTFIPKSTVTLNENQLDAVSTLIAALNGHADVMRVWDNIQTQS